MHGARRVDAVQHVCHRIGDSRDLETARAVDKVHHKRVPLYEVRMRDRDARSFHLPQHEQLVRDARLPSHDERAPVVELERLDVRRDAALERAHRDRVRIELFESH